MSDTLVEKSLAPWGAEIHLAVCEKCHWRFLALNDTSATYCPNCYAATLSRITDPRPEIPTAHLPELILPFTLTKSALAESIQSFKSGIPFSPSSLEAKQLAGRMQKLYLPMWLLDAQVSALWQAEAGFDYKILSHEEYYDQNAAGWRSREVQEQRIQWENRAGRLKRPYQNVVVPALDDMPRLEKDLGPYDLKAALTFQADHTQGTLVRLPDNPPDEAWSEASASLQKAAAHDCQQACDVGHLRQFRWNAQFSQLNWTLLLLPLYSTYYLDDEGRRQPILIHAQTGQVTGTRRASLKRTRGYSLGIFLFSMVVILIGLLSDLLLTSRHATFAPVPTLVIIFGMAGILGSALPYLIAWDFNRKQALKE